MFKTNWNSSIRWRTSIPIFARAALTALCFIFCYFIALYTFPMAITFLFHYLIVRPNKNKFSITSISSPRCSRFSFSINSFLCLFLNLLMIFLLLAVFLSHLTNNFNKLIFINIPLNSFVSFNFFAFWYWKKRTRRLITQLWKWCP